MAKGIRIARTKSCSKFKETLKFYSWPTYYEKWIKTTEILKCLIEAKEEGK